MGINPVDLRLVVSRALEQLQLAEPVAVDLVLGTAAHESGGFVHLTQKPGPALGLWQIEPATHRDLYENFLRFREPLLTRLTRLWATEPARDMQLASNLAYGAAICRLIYYRAPDPLPEPGNVERLAMYWKRFYNTAAGKGTPQQFIDDYRRYVR